METKLDVFKIILAALMVHRTVALMNRVDLDGEQADALVDGEMAKWLARFEAACDGHEWVIRTPGPDDPDDAVRYEVCRRCGAFRLGEDAMAKIRNGA